MKKVILLALFFLVGQVSASEKDNHPKEFVGVWVGEKQEGFGKKTKWEQMRKADGSYEIEFTYYLFGVENGDWAERGKWWVHDGLFYEISPSLMKKPDVYKVEVIDKNTIKFSQVSKGESTDTSEAYEFIDRRK